MIEFKRLLVELASKNKLYLQILEYNFVKLKTSNFGTE